jgi:hypothetical protein
MDSSTNLYTDGCMFSVPMFSLGLELEQEGDVEVRLTSHEWRRLLPRLPPHITSLPISYHAEIATH